MVVTAARQQVNSTRANLSDSDAFNQGRPAVAPSSDAATQCGTCKRMNSGSIGSLVSAPQSRYQPCAFALLRERRRGETAAQSGFSRWAEAEYRTNAGVAVQCAKQQGGHIFEPERRIARLPAILVFCGPAALGSSHRHRLLVAKQKSFVQFLSFHRT